MSSIMNIWYLQVCQAMCTYAKKSLAWPAQVTWDSLLHASIWLHSDNACLAKWWIHLISRRKKMAAKDLPTSHEFCCARWSLDTVKAEISNHYKNSLITNASRLFDQNLISITMTPEWRPLLFYRIKETPFCQLQIWDEILDWKLPRWSNWLKLNSDQNFFFNSMCRGLKCSLWDFECSGWGEKAWVGNWNRKIKWGEVGQAGREKVMGKKRSR